MTMQITINGRNQQIDGTMTVAQLLESRDLHPIRVAVEVNEELVPRKRFSETRVQDGDRIEIVTLVGGG